MTKKEWAIFGVLGMAVILVFACFGCLGLGMLMSRSSPINAPADAVATITLAIATESNLKVIDAPLPTLTALPSSTPELVRPSSTQTKTLRPLSTSLPAQTLRPTATRTVYKPPTVVTQPTYSPPPSGKT